MIKLNYNVPTAILAGLLWPLYFGLMLASLLVKIFGDAWGCVALVITWVIILACYLFF